MSNLSSIGIIGGGALGSALGSRLAGTGVYVTYWDRHRERGTCDTLEELVEASDIVLICTPSRANRNLAHRVAKAVKQHPGPAVITLAKGVEPGFVTMDRVLREELQGRCITGVISGPMLAAEIADGKTAWATVATSDHALTTALAKHLSAAGLIIQTSPDVAGIARCGTLKNVFALALGLADGLQLGYNSKSALMVKSIDEFGSLLTHLGSNPKLALGIAGLGDLLTTGWSGASYNWRVGYQWARGDQEGKGEGLNTLGELIKILPESGYPLVHALESILLNGAEAEILTRALHDSVSLNKVKNLTLL